ncbi:NADPH-dependent FMN reductase [Marinimicrobium agarilyticum]|uniref:NADPH-dependent FMN reductase n=1 Tax=Marinimicrobium agarilyticum TaxID=306546 RepID=UPI000685B512|nr:NADPH-dependent FMN reductase [Marinimicrobium agarilyticum]
MERLTLLALSGSLRKHSYNRAAIEALQALSPDHVEIVVAEIKDLPLFNPELEGSHIAPLETLKSQLVKASGLIIASPEYAHGISGPMKNALDWLVSGVEFPGKPIMLINTSPRASHAFESLKEVLTTMSGVLVESACVSIPLLSSGLDKDGILANREIADALRGGLVDFVDQVRKIEVKEGRA